VQINISARHGHLSTQTQALISERVEKVRRLFDRLTAIVVTCDLEHKDTPTVEVRVVAEHANEFIGTDRNENLMTALDSAIHKVEQQVRKHKEKITEHRAPGHRELAGDVEQDSE
jgi:putative sigma-54 modulation protein